MRSIQAVVATMAAAAVVVLSPAVAATQEASGPAQSYVLTFDDGADVDSVLVDLEQSLPVTITHRFGTVVQGAVVTTAAVPEEMAMLPGVATVDRNVTVEVPPVEEPDTPVVDDPDSPDVDDPATPDDPDTPEDPEPETPVDPEPEVPEVPDVPEPSDVPWGLDRVDQRNLPLSGDYRSATQGEGVVVYVVDSGISAHEQFGDRLQSGVDLVGDGYGTTDCEGHGTHVAGTIAGTDVGLAPRATVVPVRFLDCEGLGTLGGAIAAFDWIAANHPVGRPGVVNLSAGGSTSDAGDRAVSRLLERGVTLVAAAGNESASACNVAVGTGVSGVIVVGATDASDQRAVYSNYGRCVELFAPGSDVASASHESPTGIVEKSGTSMAAPHVAGAAAVLLSLDPWRVGAEVEAALIAGATKGVVADPGADSPNLLLYSDPDRVAVAAPAVVPAPPPPPVPTEVAAVVVEAPSNVVEASALAFTGGDPRAMLVMSLLMLLSGAATLAWARRRDERSAQLATVAPGTEGPPPMLVLLSRPRR